MWTLAIVVRQHQQAMSQFGDMVNVRSRRRIQPICAGLGRNARQEARQPAAERGGTLHPAHERTSDVSSCGIVKQQRRAAKRCKLQWRKEGHVANPKTPLWPELNYEMWRDTRDTLHLWTQIVGKVRLMRTPWLNHSWHVPLYVTSSGLTTSPIPHGARTFEIQFDFIGHALDIQSDAGTRRL